ncbi:MAG TPA: biliverdin-producing heme oxygenase [Kofleriaceae bacterium]
MLQQLDYATRGYHVAADAGRIALLGGNATRDKYVEYLARTYAFEAPIEARWQVTRGLERVIDVPRRLRTGFLASDLRALGCPPETVQPAGFVGIEQALGWMFVVERGRRMNGMLQRHLLRRLPAVMTIAGNYLAASSPIGTRWQQLGATLDRVAHNHAIAEQIINAAHRAFRQQRLVQQVAAGRQQAA